MYILSMALLRSRERSFLRRLADVAYANPFLPEFIEAERAMLSKQFVDVGPVWSVEVSDPERSHVNARLIYKRVAAMLDSLRARLDQLTSASEEDRRLYSDAALYYLFHHYNVRMVDATFPEARGKREKWSSIHADFQRDWDSLLGIRGAVGSDGLDAVHTLSCFHQIVRAFRFIHQNIIGSSPAAARLRAQIWQSVFTHDLRRYRLTLYESMGDFATLITGPSGTGKELVARAVALSRYVPFDKEARTFPAVIDDAFFAINLPALTSTLVESELFGHRRGAFTGAVKDKTGWLEVCPPLGSVFLDEIGDLDPQIQVKLLRVIETRTFQAVGDTTSKRFAGKLMAATNRNLAKAIRDGSFREDLYYRLCSDLIVTPSLHEQIRESPGVLEELVLFMARRVAGDDAVVVAAEASQWIEQNLGFDYAWPGNYRELEQCVRNIVIRKDYRPARSEPVPATNLFSDAADCKLTAEELLSVYCTLVYAKTGNYEQSAKLLKLDRRTVRSKIDEALLERLRGDDGW
jgi:DNA-binding NtrC family response regulator